MGHLKLFDPPRDTARRFRIDQGRPAILSFKSFALRRRDRSPQSAVERARLIHENRHCPCCDHPVVEPVELGDGLRSRNNVPIPGTATLVGFRCLGCRAEWPV